MKKLLFIYIIIIFVSAVIISGCNEKSNEDSKFLIRVDEIVNDFYPVSFQKVVSSGHKTNDYRSELENFTLSSEYDIIRDILIENLSRINVVYVYISEYGTVDMEQWNVYLDSINDGFEQVLTSIEDLKG